MEYKMHSLNGACILSLSALPTLPAMLPLGLPVTCRRKGHVFRLASESTLRPGTSTWVGAVRVLGGVLFRIFKEDLSLLGMLNQSCVWSSYFQRERAFLKIRPLR